MEHPLEGASASASASTSASAPIKKIQKKMQSKLCERCISTSKKDTKNWKAKWMDGASA